MISKVKSVTGNGSFENEYGAQQPNGKKLLFSFEYEMEDGTILKANHKTDASPFPAGTTVEYEITKTHPTHGKSGKVGKPKEEQSNSSQANSNTNTEQSKVSPEVWRKKDIAIIYQNALTQANQLRLNIGFSKSDQRDIIQELCDTADIIAQFVIKKSGI